MDSLCILSTLYGFYMDYTILYGFTWGLDGHSMDYYRILYGFDTESVWSPCGLCVVRFVSFRCLSCRSMLVHVGFSLRISSSWLK